MKDMSGHPKCMFSRWQPWWPEGRRCHSPWIGSMVMVPAVPSPVEPELGFLSGSPFELRMTKDSSENK